LTRMALGVFKKATFKAGSVGGIKRGSTFRREAGSFTERPLIKGAI